MELNDLADPRPRETRRGFTDNKEGPSRAAKYIEEPGGVPPKMKKDPDATPLRTKRDPGATLPYKEGPGRGLPRMKRDLVGYLQPGAVVVWFAVASR